MDEEWLVFMTATILKQLQILLVVAHLMDVTFTTFFVEASLHIESLNIMNLVQLMK